MCSYVYRERDAMRRELIKPCERRAESSIGCVCVCVCVCVSVCVCVYKKPPMPPLVVLRREHIL